jgi:hypothetical protein
VATRPTPTDYTDPDGILSARFPSPVTSDRTDGNPLVLKVGERLTRGAAAGKEYSVAVLDSLNTGDQEVGPAGRDAQVNSALAIVLANNNGNKLVDRPATHEGHAAREVAYVSRDDDRLTALRFVGGEDYVVRMAVTGSGDRAGGEAFLNQAAGFFDGVHLGPGFGPPVLEDPLTVSAADLAAAYQADRAAADAKYKDRWLRVAGRVRTVGSDGQEFELDAGGAVVVVRRAARARMSVPVRRAGELATATGKCRGLDPAAAPGLRVVLENATVLRPAPAP